MLGFLCACSKLCRQFGALRSFPSSEPSGGCYTTFQAVGMESQGTPRLLSLQYNHHRVFFFAREMLHPLASLPPKHPLSQFVQITKESPWTVNLLRFLEKRNRIDAVGCFWSLFLLALLASGRGLRKNFARTAQPYLHHKSILSLAWLRIESIEM